MKKKNLLMLALLAGAAVVGCKKSTTTTPTSRSFTVKIENAFEHKDYFDNGEIKGPTGPIKPGESASFSFHAGPGHYLNFATMLVESNDLFYAFRSTGLALYDADGNAVTGDVSSNVTLWDAGTEVNQEPGVGADQPNRQSAPDTGAAENGTIKNITAVNDGYTYPANTDVVKVYIANSGSLFTVTITNVSDTKTFKSPLAPGVWVIHSANQYPIFQAGSPASDFKGLEALAEDGANADMNTDISSKSGYVSPFTPGVYILNKSVFTRGEKSSDALEALAEEGDVSKFDSTYTKFTTPDGATAAGPIGANGSYTFSFSANNGDTFSLATMLVKSNDWFIGGDKIALFENGQAISGDITSKFNLYDAGTEVNEYPGAGKYQPAVAKNVGTAEDGTVHAVALPVNRVPAVSGLVKITITPN